MKKKFCQNCGKPVSESATYCNNCGAKLEKIGANAHDTEYTTTSSSKSPKNIWKFMKYHLTPTVGVIGFIIFLILLINARATNNGHLSVVIRDGFYIWWVMLISLILVIQAISKGFHHQDKAGVILIGWAILFGLSVFPIRMIANQSLQKSVTTWNGVEIDRYVSKTDLKKVAGQAKLLQEALDNNSRSDLRALLDQFGGQNGTFAGLAADEDLNMVMLETSLQIDVQQKLDALTEESAIYAGDYSISSKQNDLYHPVYKYIGLPHKYWNDN